MKKKQSIKTALILGVFAAGLPACGVENVPSLKERERIAIPRQVELTLIPDEYLSKWIAGGQSMSAVAASQPVIGEDDIIAQAIGKLLAQGYIPRAKGLLELAKRKVVPVVMPNLSGEGLFFDIEELKIAGIPVDGRTPRVRIGGTAFIALKDVKLDTSKTVFDPKLFARNRDEIYTYKYDSTKTNYFDVTVWYDILKGDLEVAKQLIPVGNPGEMPAILLNKEIAEAYLSKPKGGR